MAFLCEFCRRQFASKRNLQRHIATQHENTSFFECSECGARLNRKDNLQKHIEKFHSQVPSMFKCKHCSKTFCVKRDLLAHISEHDFESFENQNADNFECFHCSMTFTHKSSLRRHIRTIHLAPKEKTKESRIKCLKCPTVFQFTKQLNKHYVDVHGVMLNYEKLEFDCVESYKQWLEKHEHETLTRFAVWSGGKVAQYSFQRLICHRSRNVRRSIEDKDRKRCPKVSGYKRLGGICPAEIQLRIREDGTCVVKYQKTHVGHNIKDQFELQQIYLTTEEKRNVAAQIQSGIPLAQIVNRNKLLNSSDCDENFNRLSFITRQDVRNIAASQKLGFENRVFVEPGCDSADVEVQVSEHENDIIFYKRQGEEDTQYGVLDKDDFALVILTKNQEEYLRTYAHKVVSFDGTHGTNPYGFLLHTLMVLDIDCEGLPAAFLLTNRNDQSVVDIFLTCIRDRVGTLEPRTLITDMQLSYYNSWLKIMSVPQYFLYCTWHVQKAWRGHYKTIKNSDKREDTKKKLRSLLTEVDPIKFENDLNSFLCEEDEDLTEFQDYFREQYLNKTQQWAYCFRVKAGINTNMNLESFHKTLKRNIAGGQKIQTLTQCLAFIFDYLTLLKTNIAQKNIRGKVTHKLHMLRIRHARPVAQHEQNGTSKVIVIENNTYIVESFVETDKNYTVSINELKECDRTNDVNSRSCRLVCDHCKICHHAFSCTCVDSSVKSNMCKHIHLIGLYLKDQQPESSEDQRTNCEMDVPNVPISYINEAVSVSSPISVPEDVTNIEFENVSNKKNKLMRQIAQNLQNIETKYRRLDERQLQRVLCRLKSANAEVNSPGLNGAYKWKRLHTRPARQQIQQRLFKVKNKKNTKKKLTQRAP